MKLNLKIFLISTAFPAVENIFINFSNIVYQQERDTKQCKMQEKFIQYLKLIKRVCNITLYTQKFRSKPNRPSLGWNYELKKTPKFRKY